MTHTLQLTALTLLLSAGFTTPVRAEDGGLNYVVLAADSTGTTHFSDEWHTFEPYGSSDGALTFVPDEPASHIGYLQIPPGFTSDWHPAPRKQYILVLRGAIRVEAGDGEQRTFAAGSVLLVADTSGQGHRTFDAHGEGALLSWIAIP